MERRSPFITWTALGPRSSVDILTALDDPKVFAPFFRSPSWDRWRVFLAALSGLPLSAPEMEVFRHHTGRTVAPMVPAEEIVLICGRRGGKSRILATIAVHLATVPNYSDRLAPGETPIVAILAADKRQARTIFKYVRGLLVNVPLLAPMLESETAESLVLTNGVMIEVQTASYRSVRGYTLVAALCDEVAFWRDESSANPDEEVLNALRPALGTLGGLLLIASSPYAKRGALYKAFRDHYGRDDAEVLVWRGSTAEMNPLYPARLIARAYEDDPARAAAEHGAEFRNDVSAFVAREAVDGCTVPGRYELPRVPGCSYRAFVDPSGGSADSMTLAIAHTDPRDRNLAVLDLVREAKPPFSPEAVVAEFSELLKTYGIASVTGDRYGGEFCREPFRKQGIKYVLSERPKSDIYRECLPLLNSGRVELLDLKTLTTQLCSLERRTARGGKDSIDHSPGSHDDLVNAALGALLLVGTGRVMVWETMTPEQITRSIPLDPRRRRTF